MPGVVPGGASQHYCRHRAVGVDAAGAVLDGVDFDGACCRGAGAGGGPAQAG